MCFVWISEQTAIISLYKINWLVCTTEMECVYCAVRTVYLNVIQYKFGVLGWTFSLNSLSWYHTWLYHRCCPYVKSPFQYICTTAEAQLALTILLDGSSASPVKDFALRQQLAVLYLNPQEHNVSHFITNTGTQSTSHCHICVCVCVCVCVCTLPNKKYIATAIETSTDKPNISNYYCIRL